MIQKTLHYLWGKKFFILILVLVLILLPNTIGHGMQVNQTTVITEMGIERTDDEIIVTAQKFKTKAGSNSINFETVSYRGTDIRAMLSDVSLAHCEKINFTDEPDLQILHELYHYQDLRGNTKVNDEKTINELLKNQHYCYQQFSE